MESGPPPLKRNQHHGASEPGLVEVGPPPIGGSRRSQLLSASIVAAGVALLVAIGMLLYPSDSSRPGDRTTSNTAHAQTETPAPTNGPSVIVPGFVDHEQSDNLRLPGTDISVEPLTVEDEIEIGRQTEAEILEIFDVATNDPAQGELEEILNELRPSGGPWPYSVTLLESDLINAFAIPGGSIFFTTAIVALMDEDELAFVMAHEIAHIRCRHGAKQLEREALVLAGLDSVVGNEIDTESLYESAAGQVIGQLGYASFSRADESEADLFAIVVLQQGPFEAQAAVTALEKLMAASGERSDLSAFETFLQTHPPTMERIEEIEEELRD